MHRARILTVVPALLLLTHLAEASTAPRITSFCFDAATQKISFLATSGGKAQFDYTVSSSSAQTVFNPANRNGTIAAMAGGASWTISPGAAPAGQVHTFTISCTNVNGTSTTTLKLTVGGSAPGVAATNYGTDSVCAPGGSVPGVNGVGLALIAGLLMALGVVLLRRRRYGEEVRAI
jgi:hypothetical protein